MPFHGLSLPNMNTPVAKTWCYTQVKVVKFSYTWVISNFSFWYEDMVESLKSSTFSAKPNDELKWRLELKVNSQDTVNNLYLSVYLVLVLGNKSGVSTKFKCSILNNEREEVMSQSCHNRKFIQGSEPLGFRKIDFVIDETKKLLLDDKLTLLCEVSTLTDIVNMSGQNTIIQPEYSQFFQQLFQNKKFSDVTLSVRGRKFQAHKVILAAQSSVFSAMFEHEMKEKKESHVDITGVDYEVLGEVLRFLYTGKVQHLKEMAGDLLAASDMYALESLKLMCEEELYTSLTTENAIEILKLADFHNANHLKAQTLDFIKMYATDVMDTVGFKSLINPPQNLDSKSFSKDSADPTDQSIEKISETKCVTFQFPANNNM